MTAPLDFAMLPPEVNSARMYSGAGSGPMLAAASAWHGLAAELRLTATGYSSVLSELTGQAWHGPSSATMTAAVAPYVAWLSTTATQAEQTAAQAEAAVAAYEAAFAATVPPPVIAANRAQLMVLIATNFFGQNTAAIAATEAQYMEMWAQDAAAMYGYAGSSAAASQLTSFTQPEQVAIASGSTAQAAAVTEAAATQAGTGQSTLSQLLSTLPGALQSLASPASRLGVRTERHPRRIQHLRAGFGVVDHRPIRHPQRDLRGQRLRFRRLLELPSLEQRLCLRVLHAGQIPGQHVRLHGPGRKRCGCCRRRTRPGRQRTGKPAGRRRGAG